MKELFIKIILEILKQIKGGDIKDIIKKIMKSNKKNIYQR